MKPILFMIISVLFLGLMTAIVSVGGTSPRERSYRQYERNRDAILEIIEQEAYATYEQNTKRCANYWANEDYVRSQGGQLHKVLSKGNESDSASSLLDNNLLNNHPQVKLKHINLKIYRNAAWVTYQLHTSGGKVQHETRFLEKQGNRWKIVYRSWLRTDQDS
ncbi:MAG: hypothetical protein ACFB15_07395 [Cyclobacteriaceae bacterium]